MTAADTPAAVLDRLAAADEALARGHPFDPAADSATLEVPDRDRFARAAGALAALHRANPRPRPRPAPAPDRVGRFVVRRRVGGGGSGDVFLADDPDLGRPVAVKLLHSADPDAVARFQTEITATAALRHPHIVAVFEQGTHAGRPFLVTEYLDGGSLQAKIAGEPQPDRTAARVVAAVARAVHFAHEKGVVHRDLKPANILLAADGTPKVADFGLARLADRDSALTATGAAVGTPGFMAPEQAAGRSRTAGPAADVYGLGATLYKLLTGRPPFEGLFHYDVFRQVVNDDPVSVRRLNPSASRDLETVCAKCLEKNPARRYPTAAALADDLDRFLAGEPVAARPVGRAVRAARWCRRNLAVAGLLAAVIGSLSAGLAAAGVLYARAEAGRVRAETAEANADRERDAAVAAAAAAGAEAEKARAAGRALAARSAELNAVNQFVTADLLRAQWTVEAGAATADTTLRQLLDAAAGRVGGRFRADPGAEVAVRQALAVAYFSIGEPAALVPHARRVLELLGDRVDPDAAAARYKAAYLLLHTPADAEGVAALAALAAQTTAARGRDDPAAVRARAEVVWAAGVAGRGWEARALAAETLADAERVLGPRHETTARLRSNLRGIDRDLVRGAALGPAGVPLPRLGTRATRRPPVPPAAP